MRTFLTLGMMIVAATTPAQDRVAEPPCPGAASNSVRVTAQQVSLDPPSYVFLVTNLSDKAIVSLVVGQGRDIGVFSAAFNVPREMSAPQGWSGRHVFVEETKYLYYYWNAEAQAVRIAPGRSETGFRITLPSMSGLKPQGVPQVTFGGVQFRVALSDGSCRWGIVGLDKLALPPSR